MDRLTYLDPAIGAPISPAFMDFFAALANAGAASKQRLAEAEISLAAGQAAVNRGIEAIARMVANDRAAAESGGRLDWDYRIERLEFYETEAAHDLSRARRLVDHILSAMQDASPALARRARSLARRQEDAALRFVEALRDARWQVMALRAQFDPASRDGPIFTDPDELRRYLAT
jgi:hypothetical protein